MRSILAATAVVAFAFAVAGCGGSSNSGSDAAADTAVTETSSSTDTTSTDTTSTDTMSTETTSTDTTSTVTDGSLAGLTGECKDLAQASEKFGAAAASAGNDPNDRVEATANAFKALAEQAPDELKDDFEVLADAMTQYAAAVKDIDLKAGSTPTPAQIAKLAKLGRSLSAQKVQQASAAIATWSTEHCGSTP